MKLLGGEGTKIWYVATVWYVIAKYDFITLEPIYENKNMDDNIRTGEAHGTKKYM